MRSSGARAGRLYGNLALVFLCVISTGARGGWRSKAPVSSARSEVSAIQFDGLIYAVGGWNGCTPDNTVEVYDPSADTWTPKAPLPTARGNIALAVLDGMI